jgi:MFS family permease
MSAEPPRLRPLQLVFALNALGLSVWFPRIPDVKEALGLDVLTLAFCLFGMPLGTMLGFVTVPRLIRRIGTRRTVMWGGSIFLLAFIGPALAWSAPALGFALFLCGVTIATIEVSMNAKASQTERVIGRRIMTRCHAFWSFGTVIGALIAGVFAQRGIPFLTQQLVLQPLFAAATVYFALRLIPDDPEPADDEPARGFALPSTALLLMCLVPIGALLIEGAMMEWSALLMREWKGASPFVTALAFSVFAVAMAFSRLTGDALAERFGARAVMLGSGAVMAAGIVGFALAPGLWMSLPAAALTGAGAGNVYPLMMSIVGQLPGQRPEKNVATLALVAFTAFLVGPPLIGGLAHFIGLPWALAVLAPLGVAPLALLARQGRAPAIGRRPGARGGPQPQ